MAPVSSIGTLKSTLTSTLRFFSSISRMFFIYWFSLFFGAANLCSQAFAHCIVNKVIYAEPAHRPAAG
jgi:hypothetical protein